MPMTAASRRGSTLLMVAVRVFSPGGFWSQDVVKAARKKTDATRTTRPGKDFHAVLIDVKKLFIKCCVQRMLQNVHLKSKRVLTTSPAKHEIRREVQLFRDMFVRFVRFNYPCG
jgi:hypothetical protein